MSKEILDLCDFTFKLKIEDFEDYSEEDEEFHYVPGRTIYLNHSLVSLSKWEAKYKTKFLHNEEMTVDQFKDYIRMMVVYDPNPDGADFIKALKKEDYTAIRDYMNDGMTASTVKPQPGHGGGTRYQYITSELIYSWMVGLQIPSDYQYWHINRLLMLIQIVNEENQPKKKMSQSDAYARQRAANAKARAKYHSKG